MSLYTVLLHPDVIAEGGATEVNDIPSDAVSMSVDGDLSFGSPTFSSASSAKPPVAFFRSGTWVCWYRQDEEE